LTDALNELDALIAAGLMPVSVVYAKPDQQCVLNLQVPTDCTLWSAVQRSGMFELFPEIDAANGRVGVFGVLAKQPEVTRLQPGDRIEIYRPLTLDPKERRRQLAKAKQLAASKAREAKGRAANLAKLARDPSTDLSA
jgi:hypothetical protein